MSSSRVVYDGTVPFFVGPGIFLVGHPRNWAFYINIKMGHVLSLLDVNATGITEVFQADLVTFGKIWLDDNF